ncbi:MAG: topoisomerase II [Armatimonadetes bacterium]|nr:topoisomerase II [Armatimonadota bacterium]
MSNAATRDPAQQIIDDLTEELEALQPRALAAASSVTGSNFSLQSLNAKIGSKYNVYMDSVRESFQNERDFLARWFQGLHEAYLKDKAEEEAREARGWPSHLDNKSSTRQIRLLQNPIVLEYAKKLIVRTFYRTRHERTRHKPHEDLWSLWFNENKQIWGLLISPAYRNDEWVNDKSEMRRAAFGYWTVGHILSTGLVVPGSRDKTEFADVNQLTTFYRNVLSKGSCSHYEQAIYDKYIDYVRNSSNPDTEPLLIPELRYEGRDKQHKYRLDFSILNSHVQEQTGFELSPASTHMNVNDTATPMTRTAANASVSKKWSTEMQKRNDYFAKFGISVVTFADSDLQEIDSCWTVMRSYLKKRPTKPLVLEDELDALLKI